jgi:hypothetical protein
MIAFDEQELQQAATQVLQLGRVVVHYLPFGSRGGTRGDQVRDKPRPSGRGRNQYHATPASLQI